MGRTKALVGWLAGSEGHSGLVAGRAGGGIGEAES